LARLRSLAATHAPARLAAGPAADRDEGGAAAAPAVDLADLLALRTQAGADDYAPRVALAPPSERPRHPLVRRSAVAGRAPAAGLARRRERPRGGRHRRPVNYLLNASIIISRPGPSRMMKMAGKMKRTRGKSIF